MISNFKRWCLIESLGDGTETFEETLSTESTSSRASNLEIYGYPSDWGERIESATGKIIYTVSVDVIRSGIRDMTFDIKELSLDLQVVTGYDEEDNEIIETKEYVIKDFSEKQLKIEINKLPFFLDSLEIDFSQAENLDGELIPEKVMYEMIIGNTES